MAEEIAARLAPDAIPWRALTRMPEASTGSKPIVTESNLMDEPFSVHHLPPWRIVRASDGAVIGACVVLTWSIPHQRAEIALTLAREVGTDAGVELIDALLHFGFATIGLNRIEARCAANDARMESLYASAGMRPEALLREQIRAGEAFHDMKLYAMLDEER
jgi:ribosomal-protein-alanine N-acetyltransferase